jgi:hypothetical protein
LRHQRLQPGTDFGQVFEQQDVSHRASAVVNRRIVTRVKPARDAGRAES